VFDDAVTVAGALTTSKCPSAAVDLCRANLIGGKARALVVNSGNANAFTGAKGRASAESTAREAAKLIGCDASQVFVSSTGVIGEPLDAAKINAVLPEIMKAANENNWHDAARAIMTTDTFPKVASVSLEIDGTKVTLNGFAKGAGMIAPDMATMLAYVVTDAPIGRDILQAEVSRLVKDSFNAITVDSDTSTSDTLLVFATGKATLKNGAIVEAGDTRIAAIRKALKAIFANLALQIISDGEGITKLIEVQVTGAKSAKSAKRIALSIANSPLVKTAIGGGDANWGRIVMAVGKAGEPADRDSLAIWFGPYQVASSGLRHAGYSETDVSAYMAKRKVTVRADIGLGKGKAKVWTCDLTQDYVIINGDYRS
jgi:glutamate N-acetyltransferase / amino-acid N-acetyltransferase